MKHSPEDALLARLLPGLPTGAGLVVGPGDDCAVIRVPGAKEDQLLKTDCVVAGVHFLREEDPARVGWKALCRTISDVAAMGGRPAQALLTLLADDQVDAAYWKRFYKGVTRAAERFGVGIAGGELSRLPDGLAVSVALTGWVARRDCVTRSGGRPGDLLFVTGRLGGSLGGHHLDFVPRLAEARWLVVNARPRAMMDLSDGLGSDLPRLARASGCGFEVDLDAIPCQPGCDVSQALTDGEDYELLFALPPGEAARLRRTWPAAFPEIPLTPIGRLTDTNLAPRDWPGGWDHFTTPGRKNARGRAPGAKRQKRSNHPK